MLFSVRLLFVLGLVCFLQIFSRVASQGTGPIPGYVCPQEDIDDTGCKGPKDCLYSNPADCHAFIQCTDSGLAYEISCPDGLVYNDTLKECDSPATTQCLMNLLPRAGFICPEDVIATTRCKGSTDCLYPNPDDCSKFIQCRVNGDGISGTPVVQDCPAGLQWNDNKKECDYPRESTCVISTTPSSRKLVRRVHFTCPTQDIINTKCLGPKDCLYPNPESCNTFIQCTVNPGEVTGTPVVMPCPAGLEWNDNGKYCDWPQYSTCNLQPAIVPARPPPNAVIDLGFSCVLALALSSCDNHLVGNTCVYPDESDCGGYIECFNEVAYKIPCAAGTVFDKEAEACVLPKESISCSATA